MFDGYALSMTELRTQSNANQALHPRTRMYTGIYNRCVAHLSIAYPFVQYFIRSVCNGGKFGFHLILMQESKTNDSSSSQLSASSANNELDLSYIQAISCNFMAIESVFIAICVYFEKTCMYK